MSQKGNLFGATLFIAGCAIGAGTVALPLVSALAGFIPSAFAMILAYSFAVVTGFFLMEAVLWFEERVHLTTLAKFALGTVGQGIAWFFFLFLFYCLFIAYMEGGGQLFSQMLSFTFQRDFPREVGIFIFVFFVGGLVFLGTHAVSYISRIFMLGAVIAYAALITLGLPHVEKEALLVRNWSAVFATIPILLICFGYHILIPTLTHYVKRNVQILKKAILIGNAIPFFVYLLWNFVILGILPDLSRSTLENIVHQGSLVTALLEKASQSQSILFFASTFSLFAILTPFMACSIAFVDFLKDGFKQFPKFQREPLLFAIIFTPPMLCSLVYPNLFISALSFAGGFFDVVLFGLIPVLIVWVGRYKKGMQGPYLTPGGKPLLIVVMLFCLLVLTYRLSEIA